jgi:hypothetical protein
MKSILSIAALVLALVTFWIVRYYTDTSFHKKIDVNNVESIEMWGHGADQGTKRAGQEDTEKIVGWFNSMTDIRANRDFAGTTPESGIVIKLKSGNKVLILSSGHDFEIQTVNDKGNPVAYWAKQPDIKDLLKKLREG